MMSFYQLNLALFATGNAYLLYRQYARDKKPAAIPIPQSAEEADASPDRDVELENHDANGSVAASKEAVRKFQWDFFLVYALAVAADWLQVLPSAPRPLCPTYTVFFDRY